MGFYHVIAMFMSMILGVLWMLFVTIVITHSKVPDSVIGKFPLLKIPLIVLLFVFIARIWFMTMFDIQDMVNYVFGLFGCNPLELKNFG